MTITARRVRFAATRTGPRVAAAADRLDRHALGYARAAVLAAAVALPVALRGYLSHPRWSRYLTRAAELLGRWQPRAVTAALAALGLALCAALGVAWWVLVGPGLVVAGAAIVRTAYPHTIRGRVRARYGLDGWASFWELRRNVSAHAARQVTATMRPAVSATLPAVTPVLAGGQRAVALARRNLATELLPVGECGTWLGRSAVGPVWGQHCYATHRDVVGIVAPPQTAKTALLGHHVINHPGPVLTTSTKPDVYGHTAALRMRRARSGRVEVFNPEGLGGVASTMRWSPVRGCSDPSTAAERAGALVGATSAADGEDGTFWLDSAAKVLRCFLLAADLAGADMRAVHRWVTNPVEHGPEAVRVLEDREHRGRVPYGWAGELTQVIRTDAKRTRESIFLTLSQAVAFMADPVVAAAVCPGAEEPAFDVARFLADVGTLYLIMSERPHASVAPLAACFTTHLFEAAKRIAADRPRGRLDPPLGMILDEIALTTPVPLDRWCADAGGRGIHIVWSCQSPSQLAQRWGHQGADTLWNCANAKIIFGGLPLGADLEAISRLCGERREELDDGEGKVRYERVRVLPVNDLRELPQVRRRGERLVVFGLLIHRATPATIVRVTPVWERRDVRDAGPARPVPPIADVLRPATATDEPADKLEEVPA